MAGSTASLATAAFSMGLSQAGAAAYDAAYPPRSPLLNPATGNVAFPQTYFQGGPLPTSTADPDPSFSSQLRDAFSLSNQWNPLTIANKYVLQPIAEGIDYVAGQIGQAADYVLPGAGKGVATVIVVGSMFIGPGELSAAGRAAETLGPASLMTNTGGAYFWSGLGRGGAATAADVARAGGGMTLEMVLESRGIQMPIWDAANPASVAAWRDASAVYASGASGEVRAVLGDTLRPGNFWTDVELPALKANQNVTTIIQVNPSTGAETVIWARPPP